MSTVRLAAQLCPIIQYLLPIFQTSMIGPHCAGPRAQARTPRRGPHQDDGTGADGARPRIRVVILRSPALSATSWRFSARPDRRVKMEVIHQRDRSSVRSVPRDAHRVSTRDSARRRLRCSAQPPAATARHLILRPGGCHRRGNQVDGARGNSLASAAPVPRGSRSRPDSLSRATSGIAKG